MRRSRVAAVTCCLLVAGAVSTGTASASQPEERTAGAPVVAERLRPGPDPSGPDSRPGFPGPDPRFVEPEERRPGAMPRVAPRGPEAVPIPELRPTDPRPVPMPRLEERDDELLVPLPDLRRDKGPRPKGDFESPRD
jgi:hypothetical protein